MKDKRQQLMDSPEFEAALLEGAEHKKNIMTSWKQANKAVFERFNETMLNARSDIKEILAKRRKNRTDAEKEQIKKFKQETAKSYRVVCDFLTPEEVEEGHLTKLEKLADKVASAIHFLRYIYGPGSNVLDQTFAKRGILLATGSTLLLEDRYEAFKNDDVKKNIADIFNEAVNLKLKVKGDNDQIGINIYTEKVPPELQYDRDSNNAGIKPGDFRKLVDLKTKLILAKSDEAKAKIDEKIKNAAADKQFEVSRAELVRDKIASLS